MNVINEDITSKQTLKGPLKCVNVHITQDYELLPPEPPKGGNVKAESQDA